MDSRGFHTGKAQREARTKVLARSLLAAAQGASRAGRPVLASMGMLEVGRRCARLLPTRARRHAAMIVDPPGSPEELLAELDGASLAVCVGEAVGRAVAYGLPFEAFERGFFARTIRPGDIVFDVGANFGLYAALAWGRLTTGSVHAFEPNPRIGRLLRANVARRQSPAEVIVHEVAIGAKEGRVEFCCTKDSAFSGVLDTGRAEVVDKVSVRQSTLDHMVAELHAPRVDVLKVDVEGLEQEVLEGGRELLTRRDAPIVLIEIAAANRRAGSMSQREVAGLLESMGFAVHGAVEGLPEIRDLAWRDGTTRNENFVAVKPSKRERLARWFSPR